jgi:Fe(3+) dicitrate transport protein
MQGTVRVAFALLLLSWALPASAQELDDEPSATEVDDEDTIEVRVIGNQADAMQRVPGSGTVIGPEEIERADPQDAAELVRRLPGVNVRQDRGGGGRLDIGVRGLDPGRSRRVLLLEDGVPISNNPYAEPDLYWSPPAERWSAVEVVKGSGSILYGPQTVGGVINFITRPVPWRREARVEATGGQRGFFQGMGRYGDRHGDTGWLTQFLVARGDGFRRQGFRTVDALAKVETPTSATGLATVKIGLHDNVADSDDVGLTSAMFANDPKRTTLAPNNAAKLRRIHASVVHEERLDEVVSLKTLAYAYGLERRWRRQDYVRFPQAGARYERILGDPTVQGGAIYFEPNYRVLDRRYFVGGVEPRLQLRFATGAVDHSLDVGARLLGETARYQQRATEQATSYGGQTVLDESRTTVAVAAYMQDRIGFLDEHLLLTPGIRFEYAAYSRQIDRQPTSDGSEDVDIRGNSDVVGIVPGIGMTAGIPEAHGFAGLHVGFSPPRVASSISSSGPTTDLDAERSLTYELGARLTKKGVGKLSVAGFLNDFFNQVVPSSAGAQTTLVNGGRTRQMGVESAATMELGKLLSEAMIVDLTAQYTLMRARFSAGSNEGNALPYAPNHLTSTTLDVGHDIAIGAQLTHRYVGPQYADDQQTVTQDVTGRVGRIDGYHRLDASLRYHESTSGLTATVSVKDLVDRPFVISRRPEGIFAAGFRQVMFGLRWDYAE